MDGITKNRSRVMTIIIMLLAISILTCTQIRSLSAGGVGTEKTPHPNFDPSSEKHLMMETPYLERGTLYLGIAGGLFIIWFLLCHKI